MKTKEIKYSVPNKLAKYVPRQYWPTLIICVSLGLTACAFLWSALYWIVFVSVIPVYVYFNQFSSIRSLKQILFDFYLGGVIFSYAVLLWIAQADVSRWISISGVYEFLIKVAALSLASLVLASGFLILGLCVYGLRHKSVTVFILILPFIWALSEIFRSLVFALLTYAPGASIEPNWNFGALGLAAINSPFAFASRVFGLYGLTALVVVVNGAIYLFATKKILNATGLVGVAIGLSLAGYTLCAPHFTGRTLSVAAVHIANPDGSLIDPKSLPSGAGNYDIVVMPEYSEYFSNSEYETYTSSHFGSHATILTSRSDTQAPKHNQLLVYDAASDKTMAYDKQFIIPAGETLPYAFLAYFKLTGQQNVVRSFHDTQQVARGLYPLPTVHAGKTIVGPSVCSSILNPFYATIFKRQGAQLLTNSASLVFLAHAPTYHTQEKYLLRYQAISSSLPMIHASRTGSTLIIDANGHVIAESSNQGDIEIVSASLRL